MAERHDTRLRFEQWAKNPGCSANVASALLGVPMVEVALREGIRAAPGQSPFAITRGRAFERALLEDGAARLLKELVRTGVLAEPGALLDLRTRSSGGPLEGADAAIEATRALLVRAAAGEDELPAVVSGATLRVGGFGALPDAIFVLDLLVLRADLEPVRLFVGEVKTYPDRDGFTDRGELAAARAQAGVYAFGLAKTLAELGLAERISVSETGFLVLCRPGSSLPSVRAGEDLRYQAARAARGLAEFERAAERLAGEAAAGEGIEAVVRAETRYGEACFGFCERAPACRRRALEAGDPAVLGEPVARLLGEMRLPRALALMDGAAPETDAERAFARRYLDFRAGLEGAEA